MFEQENLQAEVQQLRARVDRSNSWLTIIALMLMPAAFVPVLWWAFAVIAVLYALGWLALSRKAATARTWAKRAILSATAAMACYVGVLALKSHSDLYAHEPVAQASPVAYRTQADSDAAVDRITQHIVDMRAHGAPDAAIVAWLGTTEVAQSVQTAHRRGMTDKEIVDRLSIAQR